MFSLNQKVSLLDVYNTICMGRAAPFNPHLPTEVKRGESCYLSALPAFIVISSPVSHYTCALAPYSCNLNKILQALLIFMSISHPKDYNTLECEMNIKFATPKLLVL